MPKGNTIPDRFPVPLRTSVPAEADMLKELESFKSVYGKINERLREWLIRGLKELEQRTQHVPSAGGDPTSALVAVAQELNSSVAVSQHFLTMYTQAKDALASEPSARTGSAQPVAARSSVSAPAPSPSAPTVDEEVTASAETTSDSEEPASGAKPRWGHLKTLAGG
jgi:hypothetical protein